MMNKIEHNRKLAASVQGKQLSDLTPEEREEIKRKWRGVEASRELKR